MQPLEPFRDQLVTVSKMKAPWGSRCTWARARRSSTASGRSATAERRTGDAFGKIQSKKTLDQYIADKVAADTPLRSIEVGTEDMGTAVGACDGFPCTFFNTLSWRDDTSPLPVSHQPARDLRADVRRDRLGGAAGRTPEGEAEPARLGDAGDGEAAAARWARPTAPSSTSISATSARWSSSSIGWRRGSAPSPATPEAPIGLPEAFDDHMTVTYNLMHLAFQGDISRVFTFMIGHEASDRGYAHIGIPETHHSISHHGNDAGEAREVRQDRHLPDREVRRVPRQAEGDAGRRRHAARSLAALLGQRHEQRQRARSQQPAGGAGRRRARPAEGQSSRRREEGRADREPAARAWPILLAWRSRASVRAQAGSTCRARIGRRPSLSGGLCRRASPRRSARP